jgi:hypothetical protein
MSEDERTAFTDDEILYWAQMNFTYLFLGTLAFLKNHSLSPEDYVNSLARQFAAGWEPLRSGGPAEVARAAALNAVSTGSTLRSLSGDAEMGEAVVEGWPSAEALSFFGQTRSDAEVLWNIFEPIAAHLGLHYKWEREGDAIRMTFWR